ncbi:dicarboxylate/amino acid:cation symporter [Paludisphaera rhizosphaerae]|uniref:dicarboxylate/amino acid:cation symporter n=1 Tax=Paludisphaera rhizosphaerae TaxID=2711216 RepID=UPI0013EB1773|nr:dicarboxylate/amino acid:cation symporter [Paludisphaera rhizosphaerae]
MPPSEYDRDDATNLLNSELDPTIGAPPVEDEPESSLGGLPLYVWVIIAVLIAIPLGWFWGEGAKSLEIIPNLIMRALTALAAPLVVLAILHAIVANDIRGRQGAMMMFLYLINTLVAMMIGLGLSNLIQPGAGAELKEPGEVRTIAKKTVSELVTELVPKSIGEAFATNNIAQLVVLTIALGIGLVKIRDAHRAQGKESFQTVVDLLSIAFELMMKVLLWVVALVPLAVLGIVAAQVGHAEGMRILGSLVKLIGVVVLGLCCQVTWYLLQMAFLARMSPVRFLKGAADVMANTFSTASTAATIPITLKSLGRLGVTRQSSQLCACIGTNFNNDGTALYQATAALFMAQALGYSLSLTDQVIIMLTTLVASVGAGGIPSGSFVTMPLIFAAVRLPADKIPILLTIDWFLDRCRTTSNVLGDMTVAVLLDKLTPPTPEPVEAQV